jgi:hypothetical protein
MTDILNWNGSVWGPTTKGTVFMEMLRTGNHIEGRLCVMEPGLGQLNALFVGEWSADNGIRATLNQFTGAYSVPVTLPQTGRMEGTFDPAEGVMSGTWNTDAQTLGKFLLVKIESQQQQIVQMEPAAPAAGTVPAVVPAAPIVQANAAISPLITKTVVLGSYRLDEQAVRRLVDLVKRGTNVITPAINASHKGSEHIHIGVDSLLADPSVPAVVYNLIVAANEPIVKAGTNTVVVNLKKGDANTLFVSGYDRIWVEGKAAEVKEFLDEHQTKATYILRNYGQTLNSLIFLAMLAFLPSIPSLRHRVIVVAFVFALLLLLMYSWRLAANTKIFLREAKSAWYEKNAGWLLVLLEVGLGAWVGYLIQRFMGAAH